jgi:hypothetical protein
MPQEPLAVGASGDNVAQLHNALLQLGFQLPDSEVRRKFLGPATRQAVQQVQQQHGLPVSGELDEKTATAITARLTARDPQTSGLEAEVSAVDPAAAVARAPFGPRIERPPINQPPGGQPGTNDRPPPQPEPNTVLEGSIVNEYGLKLEGVRLRLYRRGFGGTETLLTETTTGELGRYTLSYDVDGNAAGLEVRAVDAAGKEIALSKVLHDLGAAEHVTVNLVAPATLQAMTPEYQRLAEDLTPIVGDMGNLAGSREDPQQQDLSILFRSTGWDARLLALAASAARLSTDPEVGMSQSSVYALLRAGLPSEKLQLARAGSDVAERALKTARTAGIVNLNDEQIGQIKSQFATFASKTRLAAPIPGSRSTYGEFIESSGISSESQDKFAKVLLGQPGSGEGLWEAATKAGIPDADLHTLQLQGKLAFLTGHSKEMTTRIHQSMGIKDPFELVAKGMYSADSWKAEAKALSGNDEKMLDALIPPVYEGADVQERLTAYCEDMARKVRLSYNTHVIGHIIETDPADRFGLGAARGMVAAALKSATMKGFRFGTTPFDAFVKSKPQVFNGVPVNQVETVRQEMRTLQRTYQLTPNDEAMEVLRSIGLTSAYDIVAIPREAFVQHHGHRFKSPKDAELVYRKAQQVSSVTYNLFTVAKKLDAEAPVYGMSAPVEVRQTVKTELIKQFPTMETLFGSMDFCECEHCHSVLSPAAYLVDLLQFLDPETHVWDNFLAHWSDQHGGQSYTTEYQKPYDALIARRPDITNIPLTCENTHTVLPYIDIVNEILEYYVANGRLTEGAARDTGDAASADLLAEPANVIREAYDRVLEARYPHTLPFDLWLETVRRFCEHFEVPLWQVLETFRPSDKLFAPKQVYDRFAIFTESLALSPAQVAIFTDPNPLGEERWRELYGYTRAPIDNPTNAGDATVAIPDALAESFTAGEPCTYLDVSAGTVSAEAKTIKTIGAKGSGGVGRTTITFDGTWATPPAVADLLMVDVPGVLKSAKALSRRLGVTYKELIEIVKTGFVNPALDGLTVLYKLDLTMTQVLTYVRDTHLMGQDPNTLTVEEKKRQQDVNAFEQRLADKSTEYAASGFDAKAWLTTALQANAFADILVLNDLNAGCDFDATILRYADGRAADPIAFLELELFVRLWRALGWTIEETDRALQAFVPKNAPFDAAHLARSPLKTALISIAHARAVNEHVKLGKDARQKLLTLWSDIPTTGNKPLYAQLFLTQSVLRQDDVFDDPMGRYLSSAGITAMAQTRTHRVELANVAPADAIDPAPFAPHPRVTLSYDPLREAQSLSYQGVLSDADETTLRGRSASPALAVLLDAVQAKAQDFTRIKGHLPAIQGALGLTADEVDRILHDAGMTLDTAKLTLANVSLLYRYGLLAKAVGLPVGDLIALKDLSGLDPFQALHADPLTTLEQDHPFTQTIRFIEVAEQMKDSGLSIADLEYLLRHRFDQAGPYRPDTQGNLTLLRTIGAAVRGIRAEHAVPDDPGVLTEEVLRPKLGLVLPADVVDRFLGMINGTAEFTATKDAVDSADQLDPTRFSGEPAIVELSYNATRKQQKLTFRGVLFDEGQNDLKARLPRPPAGQPHIPSTVFADLLDDVQAQARAYFDKHLKRQEAGTQPGGGFLVAADFDLLFRPPAAGATDAQLQARLRDQRAVIANSFLPYLQQRLIRQLVVETMTAQAGAEATLVEALVTDSRLLVHPASSNAETLVDAFAGCGTRGLSAEFFGSNDGTGAALGSAVLPDADLDLTDQTGAALRPSGTNSARLDGYLEVPTPGAYRFFVFLKRQDASAQIRFADLPAPLPVITATKPDFTSGGGPADFVELKAGALHRFSVELRDLAGAGAKVMVQGETLPKDRLATVPLTPAKAIEAGERTRVLLAKVVQLIQALELNERELRYMATHAAAFENLDLGKLPTQTGDDTTAGARQRFAQFLRLAAYAHVKRDVAGATDDLISIFEAPTARAAYPILATITRRPQEMVKAASNALFDAPAFTDERPVQRLWDALQVIERFGVAVDAIVSWTPVVGASTTPTQRFQIAQDLKHTLKARFAPEAWNRVAQPIFDRLRARQRDALVAYVMHQRGFLSREQLYEYFLIDPGMEPVVQTSRIRLASGSVQLFIQRILLNLEPTIHPSAIVNAKHWEWMKRYRVWEANRKIFLFPENWLEPEFRDDKTHLYAELEGTLLQGDVSNDLVEDAFLNYLRKLDELARLDIVGMHLDYKDDPAQNTLHVIGRTYSEPHKYFYRRYAHRVWTPWEPVSAEITGNHLAPVVWRDRLYLFWVTFMERADDPKAIEVPKDPAEDVSLGDAKLRNIVRDVRATGGDKKVEAHLNWSEYYNGEWSTRESAGVTSSVSILAPVSVPVSFDTNDLFVHVAKRVDGEGNELGVEIHLDGFGVTPLFIWFPIYLPGQAFYLPGRNSLPERSVYRTPPSNPYSSAPIKRANRYGASRSRLTVSYAERLITENGKATPAPPKASQDILQQGESAYTILPCDNAIAGDAELTSLIKPIFYQDNAQTLFVEPSLEERRVEDWQNYVTETPPLDLGFGLPDRDKVAIVPEFPHDPRDPIWNPPLGDETILPVHPSNDWLINPGTGVLLDGQLIGPKGHVDAVITPAIEATTPVTTATTGVKTDGQVLPVSAGGALASGATLVGAGDALDKAGLQPGIAALNIVGGDGFNTSLAHNLELLEGTNFGAGRPATGRWA